MTIDFKKLAAEAAAKVNMQEAQKGGGGDYQPPAAGIARARLVAYIELGKHRDEYQGQVKVKDKVQLVFELSGPKHEPREAEDGTKYPHRITITESLSLNEKANFFKLFNKMRNGRAEVQHMSQMLGEPFLVKVVHKTSKNGKTYAQLRELTGEYTIKAPVIEDEDGNVRKVKVADPLSELRLFIWDLASKEMWDSLFIDGEYEARTTDDGVELPAKSKNVLQNKIREALNFEDSPIGAILQGADDFGDELDEDDEYDNAEVVEEEEEVVEEPKKEPAKKPAKKPAATKGKKPSKEPVPSTADDDPLADLDDDIPF